MFTEEEKSRILHALGYPKFSDVGAALGFAHPSANAASDMVYDAFRRLDPHGEQRVREDLAEIECIHCELRKLRPKASITGASETKFDPKAARLMLLGDLRRATETLALDLGAPINPLSPTGGQRVVNVP